ncbi:TlpA family protein disulfide reductase [Flammeovirga aprica]|uniref:TlpA family protein disulfide reductase n=1 Tax=Flammeovirga aprica JL-4 TaxID=694437 RepID=A0A7X9RTF6_9BACT|nr:TlpA disulfide reductase family protein [Flammeovirga aprica]NME68430.1 TlpA family protein disulfide reductase [Flammeovirga aprica JL-4]
MKKNNIITTLTLLISITLFSFLNVEKDSVYTFKDLKGNEVNLTDFKGKYVYIDVWASWCGPCLGEIPSLKALEESHKDGDVVFVSLSVDQDTKAWKKMVEKKELHGNQFHYSGNQDFIEKFNISAIPRFILLDKDGKVKESNAPRPSSSEIKSLFKKLGI